jgi:hypothetical protein
MYLKIYIERGTKKNKCFLKEVGEKRGSRGVDYCNVT